MNRIKELFQQVRDGTFFSPTDVKELETMIKILGNKDLKPAADEFAVLRKEFETEENKEVFHELQNYFHSHLFTENL
jgi:hypothetical protein